MATTFARLVRPDQDGVGPLCSQAVRRFARCNKGISSVEFVIVLPILMLFLFGIITFATTLYIQVNMENAAREGARRMAVAEAGGSRTWVPCTIVQATTAGTAENYACIYLADWPISFEVYAEPGCPPRQSHRSEREADRVGERRGGGIGRCLRLLRWKDLDRQGRHAQGGGLRLEF